MDAQRAAEIVGRIRLQFQRGSQHKEAIDLNEINLETVALLRGEATLYNISVRTELAAYLPRFCGDRVQLQQVAMNLIVNGIEAMKGVDDGKKNPFVFSPLRFYDQLSYASDTGLGLTGWAH